MMPLQRTSATAAKMDAQMTSLLGTPLLHYVIGTADWKCKTSLNQRYQIGEGGKGAASWGWRTLKIRDERLMEDKRHPS